MSIKNIDYSKYSSTSGLSTSHWGPSGWHFLFSCIMGGFPNQVNDKNKDHIKIKHHFKMMLLSLGYTMPCIYCRESYQQFCKEFPIEPFLKSRMKLMEWLYTIRNKVNQKLQAQEKVCYNDEKKRLKLLYHQNKINKDEYYTKVKEFKNETFKTKDSPSFIDVLDKYEASRAICSNKAKTCSLPNNKNL
jgi:hypothetical protein